jgi:competence protein ComEA
VPEPPLDPPRPFPLPERGLDRVRALWDDSRVRVGALLVVALVAGFVWYRLGAGSQAAPRSDRTAVTSTPATVATTTPPPESPPTGRVTVHVAGAVLRPGVVRVDGGARVVDAIDAAGGGLPDADLDRLNLAAKVVDGQRVAVAKIGAPAPVEATPGGAAPGDTALETGPLNLNTATQAQLEELPGIGPTLAAAIIAERDERGGFRDVAELQDVRGIGEMRYADIKDLVAV